MGTSQSSSGPGAGVPLVPPWAEKLDDAAAQEESAGSEDPDEPDRFVPLAPRARFRSARSGLGRFADSGNNRDLRRALGHYVSTGYGGAGTMARRLGSTAATAGRLDGVLQAGVGSGESALRDVVLASAGDVNVLLDAIVDAASPVNGTQDSESSRRAIRNSLADLLERFPEADLLALTDVQREFVIERYVALDVYGRFCLDLQQAIVKKASDPATALRRLRQVREFIYQQVAAAFRVLREAGSRATSSSVSHLAAQALRDALGVFEEYV